MTDLKTKIARGEYKIDSRELAETIISKLQTVSRVRTLLDRQNPSRTSPAAAGGGRFDVAPAGSPAQRAR